MNREGESSLPLEFAILASALAGFAINLLLLVRRYSDAAAGIAGCGGGSCEEVLTSRWSALFGLPVTVFGLLVYAGLMVSMTERGERLHKPLLGAVAGGVAWFVFAQAVLLGKFCPWCMAAHGAGIAVLVFSMIRLGSLVAFRQVGVWGIAAFLCIGLAQVYGPHPSSHRMEDVETAVADAPVQARGEGRVVSFDGGRKSYNVRSMPHLGSANAKHVLVEYFDYQCPACRIMAGYLDALVAKYPSDIAVLLLPMPLETGCNRHVSARNEHPGSCEIARIALAVWRKNPAAFPAFHHALISDPSVDAARRLAAETIPPQDMAAALTEPWIDELLRADIEDWHAFSKTTDKLPKLLVRDKRIVHGLPTSEEDFIRVIAGELGLQ
jgi:uncharacterized membrane protein